jgi:hypothetical protein
MYNSKYCEVSYLQNKNAVLCKWKSYCKGKDYKEPLEYGLELINKHNASIWITDATNGFRSEIEDNVWLANEFSPRAINSTVKTIIFIIDNNSELYDEILLHSNILKQFFEVKIISSIDQI